MFLRFCFDSAIPAYSEAALGLPLLRDLSWLSFSLYFSLLTRKKIKGGKGEGQSLPEEPRADRGGRCPDGSSGEAPESDFYLITRNRRQRERKEGARASQRSPGGQTTRRDSGEVPEKEPWSRLRQRRDRSRRKLRKGPGVG